VRSAASSSAAAEVVVVVVVDYRASAPRAHRHDDLKVTGFELADGPQHTRPLVSRELEGYLRTSDDLKGISQIPAVEGDLPGVATHAGVELADVISHLGTGGLDEHLAERGGSVLRWRRALQSYDIRVVASEDRGDPGGAQQIRVPRMTLVALSLGMMRS
jgi:hypothetical protein